MTYQKAELLVNVRAMMACAMQEACNAAKRHDTDVCIAHVHQALGIACFGVAMKILSDKEFQDWKEAISNPSMAVIQNILDTYVRGNYKNN